MVKYQFSMKVQGCNDEYQYIVDLQQDEEDNPEWAFTPQRREQLKASLQQQSACKIDDPTLNRILKVWQQDIGVGVRISSLTLDLPLLADSLIDSLQEGGNQEIPDLFKPDLSGISPLFGALPPLIFQ